jgi:hypothetical protein
MLVRSLSRPRRCHIADFFAHERAADGRGSGDHALGDIAFLAGHQLVNDLLVLGGVKDHQGGAERSLVAGDVGEVHERQLGHALLHHAQTGAHELLALLGHVVLGVLGEIAHRYRFFEFGGKFVVQLVFEDIDFFLQLLFDVFRHLRRTFVRTKPRVRLRGYED